MTSKQQLLIDIAAILSTLSEIPSHEGVASSIYMALGHDYERYINVASIMDRVGYIKMSTTNIKLTPLGLVKAQEINAAIEGR